MSIRDGLGAVGVGGTVAAAVDLLANSGQLVMLVVDIFLNQSGLIYLIMARLAAAAPGVPWLPADLLQTATTAIALITACYGLYRLAKNIIERRSES